LWHLPIKIVRKTPPIPGQKETDHHKKETVVCRGSKNQSPLWLITTRGYDIKG
jgi:hypothetical protein